jgi:hypothetical protein
VQHCGSIAPAVFALRDVFLANRVVMAFGISLHFEMGQILF